MIACKIRLFQTKKELFFRVFLCYLAQCFFNVQSTEVTVGSTIIDNSLGLEIELPILVCHARHTGYSKVTWYKDFIILKNGSSGVSSHVLSLASLLNSSTLSEEFDNPLKLQGYYWCVTDHTEPTGVFDYLFRIEEITTFVGRFVAKEDSLGESDSLTRDDKITWKKKLYEEQMETTLFGFLQAPSVYVTDIKEIPAGLDVRFFIYIRPAFHPRKPVDEKLILDEDNLKYVVDYLNNETSTVDPILYLIIRNWTDIVGLDIQHIDIKSTLGCYEEHSYMSTNENEVFVWPYARIGDVVIPDNACSSKDGISVTRMCTGSFYLGAKWGNPSGKCEKPADGITLQLKNIYNLFGNVKKGQTIKELVAVTKRTNDLRITDLHIAVEILKELSLKPKLNPKEINGIVSTIDNIIGTNKSEIIAAKNIIHLTSRILSVFDNILMQTTDEQKEIKIAKHHLILDTKYTRRSEEQNPILGLAVIAPNFPKTLYNGSIEVVTSKTMLPQHESLAYFALPRELVLDRESDMKTKSSILCEVSMVLFKDWHLFQNPKSVLIKRNYKVMPSPVLYVSISGGPAWNLTDPVQIYFKDTMVNEVEDPVCVYYDPRLEDGTGAWSSEGCEYEGNRNGYYHCQCHHLSIFAIILSQNPDLSPSPDELKLGTSVYVACGASILALSLAVILFVLSKIWRQTIDHSILFSLSLCFLVCTIIIFISETHFARRPGCIVLALILHYTIFTIFGWLLIQAIIYRLRFAKKTDVGEIPYFMIKTGSAVWGVPIIIVGIMWFSREYPEVKKDNCWLTVTEVSKEAVIPMVVLIIIVLCVYGCATYALICFKKDFLVSDLSSYNDVVVKFRVAFTIFLFFVFTWLFGFLALHKQTQSLRILFSICMTLTAYYLALFFIFQEVSLWELCRKCKQNKVDPEEAPPVQYQAKTYQSVEESIRTEK